LKITVFYVGTSLPGPLKEAERAIRKNKVDIDIALHNCGDSMQESGWAAAEQDIAASEIVFIIHVTNSDNASLIISALQRHSSDSEIQPVEPGGSLTSNMNGAASHPTVIAINCMPDLMRMTCMGKLDFGALMKPRTRQE